MYIGVKRLTAACDERPRGGVGRNPKKVYTHNGLEIIS